jgi:HSP20 family protein
MDRRRNTLMQLGQFSPMRRMMEELWGPTSFPQVEVLQRGENLVVRADLPGLESKDVNVEVDDHTLTIKGERSSGNDVEEEGYFHSERSYGSFERRIALPAGCDRKNIDATFQNGVLEVTLKLAKMATQKIPIRGAEAVPTTHENKAPTPEQPPASKHN